MMIPNSVINGGSGGGGSPSPAPAETTEKYLPVLKSNSTYLYVELLGDGLKSTNAEYYFSIRGGDVGQDGTIIDIAGIFNARTMYYGLTSWNSGNEENDTIISPDDLNTLKQSGERIDFKVVVSGETKSWFWKKASDNNWTTGPVITDTGMNPQADTPNFLGNNSHKDNSCEQHICWTNFRIVSGGQTLFDASTAVRGVDYNVYNEDGATVLQLMELL